MDEKMVTIYVGGYPRRCLESKVEEELASIERVKQYYREKGIPQEMIEKGYSVRIVRDEN